MKTAVRIDEASVAEGGRVARVDFLELPKLERFSRTPQGGYYVPARVGRSGVLVYQRKDGTLCREYRPPAEAFSPRSLASLEDAVVTVGHPPGELVSPATFRKYAAGHVRGGGRRDDRFIAGELAVEDSMAIGGLAARVLVEISSGYTCILDPTPGTDPETGERYDAVQRDVVYNHVALLPPGHGRAGRDVKVALDSSDREVRIDGLEAELDPVRHVRVDHPQPIEARADMTTKLTEKINGREYEIGSAEWWPPHVRQIARLDELEAEAAEAEKEEKTVADQLAELKKSNDTLKGQLDAATAEIGELKKKLGEETSGEKMDSLVAERVSLIDVARRVLGTEAKFDGKSNDTVRREVITKLDGAAVLLDGDKPKGADYVVAYFESLAKRIGSSTTAPAPRTDANPTGGPAPKVDVKNFHTPPSRRRAG